MKYCTKCGNEMMDEASFCVKCGCMVEVLKPIEPPVIEKKEEKVKNEYGILCFIFGCVAFILSFFLLALLGGDSYYFIITDMSFLMITSLIISVIYGIKDFYKNRTGIAFLGIVLSSLSFVLLILVFIASF